MTNCTLVDRGEVNVYLANSVVTQEDTAEQIRRVEIGQRQPGCKEIAIILIGATGSGKSTLLNCFINHTLGVEWTDDYRVKLVEEGRYANQAQSQTNWITSYTIHHRPEFTIPYTLTIIDTPGFAGTAGIKRDQEITDQIRAYFTAPGAVDSLDAVGFVAQSALPRLTPGQKYIFDSILSLFGRDIDDNIIMLLTFADGQKPQILAAIKEAKIPYKKYCKFNNSALFVGNMEVDEYGAESNIDEMFWKMCRKNFKIFITELDKLQKRSLMLTQDVLKERCRLEITAEGIQIEVKMGLNKLEELRVKHQALDHHQSNIDKNKDFTYTVDEQVIETKPTNPGQYMTNCITCKMTCHENCAYADVAKCPVMKNGFCTICEGSCHWSTHKNQPCVYNIVTHRVTKTAEDLEKKYEVAMEKRQNAEKEKQKCLQEFVDIENRVSRMAEGARISIDRLEEIALRRNPLFNADFLDILITSEKAEARCGWKERMEQLVEVKEKAEQVQAIAQQGYDPFVVLKQKYDDERKQRQQMRLQQLNQ